MQNSIWKLTALAGVIGVGFLIVLQAQDGLNREAQKQALVPSGVPGPADVSPPGSQPSGDDSATSLWELQPSESHTNPGDLAGNSEPPVGGQSEPGFDSAPGPFDVPASDIAASDPPGTLPPFEPGDPEAGPIGTPSGIPSAPPSGLVTVSDSDYGPDPFTGTPATDQPEPLPLPEPGRLPDSGPLTPPAAIAAEERPELSPGETDPELPGNLVSGLPELPAPTVLEGPLTPPGGLPEFSGDSGPALPAPGELPAAETAKDKALRLMAEAEKAMDGGQLLTARELAVEAAALPVVYGPLQMRPSGLIQKIDAKLDAQAAAPVPTTILTGLPEPAGPIEPDEFQSDNRSETSPGTLPVAVDLPSPFPPAAGLSEPLPLPGLQPEEGDNAPLTVLPDTPPPFELDDAGSDIKTVTSENVEPAEKASVMATAGTAELPRDAPAAMQRPELTIEKSAPDEATLSEPMVYSIQISNRGAANAARVVVEDQIPKGCRLVGTIPQAELIGTKLLWRLGRLPSGESKKILVKVVPIEEGEIGSIATVSFVSEVATRTAVRQPVAANLRLKMQAPDQANVGQGVVFSFQIENTGKKDATDVKLQDIIPVGFEHPAGKDLTYDVGTIAKGESFEIDLELKAVEPGTHTNRVIVKSDDGTSLESLATVEVIEHSGLKLSVESGQTGNIGQRFSQQITVTNDSSQSVSNGSVILVLPRPLRFVSATSDGTLDDQTGTIRWPLPTMEPGQSLTVEATAIAAQPGQHKCLVQLTQPGHDMQSLDVIRRIRGFAALHLDLKDVPATVFPDDEFAVNVRVLNRGSSADSDVSFSVVIPPELEFVKARGPVRDLPSEAADGVRRVSFTTIPEIGDGASVDFEITLRARAPGRPKLRAEVSSSQLAEAVASEAALVVIDTAP